MTPCSGAKIMFTRPCYVMAVPLRQPKVDALWRQHNFVSDDVSCGVMPVPRCPE